MTYAIIFLAAAAAGFVQAATGFGSGMVMMMVFPVFMPVLKSSALSAVICISSNAEMVWTYRRSIRWDMLWLPTVCYIALSTAAILIGKTMESALLLKVFGGFLLVLATYFMFSTKQINVRATPLTAGVCASLAGAMSGLFGIGGPPLAIYYLAALGDKREYLGTIQALFLISGLWNLGMRTASGIYTADLLPMTAIGLAGILIGSVAGGKVVNKLNADVMKKIIYVFLGLSGLINLLK